MSRSSLYWLAAVVAVSSACYSRAGTPQSRNLTEIMRRIDRSYLEPVDRQALFEGAVEGMMSKLDENSSYIGRDKLPRFQEMLDQEFVGIGIEPTLDPKTSRLAVKSPIAGSPAFKAGVRAGDRIVKIDGHDTSGMSLNDALHRLRGERGTAVELTIERGSAPATLAIRIVRDRIQVESVVGDRRHDDGSPDFRLPGSDGIGYVRIGTFGEHTADEFARAMSKLDSGSLRGLILDLRENPGGMLDAATEVCQQLIEPGKLIVSTRGRGGRINDQWHAAGKPHLGFPVAVLVDRNSASASEIVAACLQDHGRGAVIGERTFGKGTVQRTISIEGGRSKLKLTTASYWRPSGRNIHRLSSSKETDEWGVRPDAGFDVPLSKEQLDQWRTWRHERDVIRPPGSPPPPPAADSDAALKRAVEHVQGATTRKSR